MLLQDGAGVKAGRVQLHCDIAGHNVSLVQPFILHQRTADTALAIWAVQDDSEVFETKHILAAVEHCTYSSGRVGTLLPLEYT